MENPQPTPQDPSQTPALTPAPVLPPEQVVQATVKTFQPDEVVEFPDGTKTTWGELQQTRQELTRMREAGADLYIRAINGDQQAMQEFINRYSPKNEPVNPVNPTPPQQPVDLNTLKQQLMQDPEIAAWRQTAAEIQATKAREVLTTEISKPEFAAFQKRPDAVDILIERLNAYYQATGKTPDVSMIRSALTVLNKQETEYQEKLLAPFKQAAGDLGVNEPFRGGAPVQDPGARPDIKDRSKYTQWLSNKLAWAAKTQGE